MDNVNGAKARVVACMPTWNAAEFIEPVLRSLDAQTYPDLQILISDDASSDTTVAVCERFARDRPRFSVHRQARNLGWIGNVNWLLKHAEGEYLFFAFHDDPLEPTYVEALVAALEAAPNAVLAFSDITIDLRSRGQNLVTQWSFPDLDGVDSVRERLRVLTPMEGHWWIPNRGLFRSSAARSVGGMRKHLAGELSADWPWLIHLSLLGGFVRVPEPLLRKVWRQEGLSLSWNRRPGWRVGAAVGVAREIARADVALRLRVRLLADFWSHWLVRWWRGRGRWAKRMRG